MMSIVSSSCSGQVSLMDVFNGNVTEASFVFLLLAAIVCLALLVAKRPSTLIGRAGSGDDQEETYDDPNASLNRPPPGPKGFPVIGSLHLLATPPLPPWTAFTQLYQLYGDVFRIQLGNTECVVVNTLDTIREVLLKKADHFSGRPNFIRYHVLFGGNRDNSMALCDWSKVQTLRRRLAKPYLFPRQNSDNFNSLEAIIENELQNYVDGLVRNSDRTAETMTTTTTTMTFDKLRFSLVTANIFCTYFCSKRYDYDDVHFRRMCEQYDLIFENMNQGFALDFLPWLLPFYVLPLIRLYGYGQFIRHFLAVTLFNGRHAMDEQPNHLTFLDAVLSRIDARKFKRKSKRLSSEYALNELEDILGGHSAVSCFWARVLVQLAQYPDVQQKIREEMTSVLEASGENTVRLHHRQHMPYMRAVIMETLRMTTSPVVPHVAVQDTSIAGYAISKNTLIFLNTYYLNTSDKFWTAPNEFNPERFINSEGRLVKPSHFLPFGIGKRSCIGHHMVQSISLLATAQLLRHFDVSPSHETNVRPVEAAKLSVYDESVRVVLSLRSPE